MSKKDYKKTIAEPQGQVPPNEKDIEDAVLGALLLESNILDQLIADFSPSLFYTDANRLIAETMIDLYKTNSKIDILTVTQDLKKKDKLEIVGGAYYVSMLTNRIASSANIEFHVKILQQKFLERNLIHITNKAVVRVINYKDDVFDVYSGLQGDIDDSLKDVLHYEVSRIKDIHEEIMVRNINIRQKGIKSGVPTGFRLVDNVTNGWQKSDLIILAGRPGMGKTAAAVSMVAVPAIEENIPVAIFSLEMSCFQLGGRIQSFMSGVNVSKIIKGQLNEDEERLIWDKCSPLDKAPLFIDDTPNISLLELKSKARKLVKENNVELIIIDYLQLMRSGLDIQNREQEIAAISRGLKALAKELNIPIIALSQLSRLVEARSDKKPMLSDLRESGQIEQDADMVIFCYRPEYYGIEQYEIGANSFDTKGLFMFLVAKHRNGELGEIPMKFIHEQAKVTNYDFNSNSNTNTIYSPNTKNENKVEEPVKDIVLNKMQENTDFLSQSNNNDEPF